MIRGYLFRTCDENSREEVFAFDRDADVIGYRIMDAENSLAQCVIFI